MPAIAWRRAGGLDGGDQELDREGKTVIRGGYDGAEGLQIINQADLLQAGGEEEVEAFPDQDAGGGGDGVFED